MSGAPARAWSRRAFLLAGLGLAVAACGSAGSPEATGVLTGVTDVDAGCPPTPDAGACPRRRLPALLRVVRLDHIRSDVEVRSAEDGTFRVELPAGRYEVVPENLTGTPYPRADPTTVEVREGTSTRITVAFDSGVR
jgi:hypothetical protein